MSRWQRFRSMLARAGRSVGRGIAFVFTAITSPFDFRDVMLFGGSGLLGYGLYQVYQPAAFIVTGMIFVFVSVATIGKN